MGESAPPDGVNIVGLNVATGVVVALAKTSAGTNNASRIFCDVISLAEFLCPMRFFWLSLNVTSAET